jgi:hypothetical protein
MWLKLGVAFMQQEVEPHTVLERMSRQEAGYRGPVTLGHRLPKAYIDRMIPRFHTLIRLSLSR